jgi:hypothetical protein
MTDAQILQEFFDVPGIGKKMGCPISVDDLVMSASGLRDLGAQPGTSPRDIISCLNRLLLAIGPHNLLVLADVPARCDDHWASWCPSPAGVHLHQAECPAGTTPLWSNGTATVFYRLTKDKHGNDVMDFGVHPA